MLMNIIIYINWVISTTDASILYIPEKLIGIIKYDRVLHVT